MAVPTWRNVGIDSNQGANALIQAGTSKIESGINTAANIAGALHAREVTQWNDVAQRNTDDVLTGIARTSSLDELDLNAADGAFNIDKLDTTYGTQYNRAAVVSALETRRAGLIKAQEVSVEKARANASTLINDERAKRMRMLSQAITTTRASGKFSDPDAQDAALHKAVASLNQDGILDTALVDNMITSASSHMRGAPLDKAASIMISEQEKYIPEMVSTALTKVNTIEDEFLARAGFDKGIDRLNKDEGTMGQAIDELAGQLQQAGDPPPDTVNINAKREQVRQMFAAEGLKEPSGALFKEIMKRSGRDDAYSWFDAKFVLSSDEVKRAITAVKMNNQVTETNAEQLMEFSRKRGVLADTYTDVIGNNVAQANRLAMSKASTGQVFEPAYISNASATERTNAILRELKGMVPSGTSARHSNQKPWIESVVPKTSTAPAGEANRASSSSSSR